MDKMNKLTLDGSNIEASERLEKLIEQLENENKD